MTDALAEAGRIEPTLVPASRSQTLWFFISCCATSVAILAQAATARVFVDKTDADNWVTIHGIIADASWVLCAGQRRHRLVTGHIPARNGGASSDVRGQRLV